MALCKPFGFLAYNISEPAPHGFITRKLVKQYPPGVEPSEAQRTNPQVGQTFKLIVDPQDPTAGMVWVEERQMLPSNRLGVEFVFRTKSTSNNITLSEVVGSDSTFGLGVFGGGAGTLGIAIANSIFLGGITPVRSKFAWHACSAVTKYDVPIKITQEILESKEVKFSDYLMTVIGVFDEPLALTDAEKSRIGITNARVYGIQGVDEYIGSMIEGQDKRDLDGDGQLDDVAFFPPENKLSSQTIYESKNRFEEQIFDERVYRFRSDATSGRYAFGLTPTSFQDLSSKTFKIKTDGLKVNDVVYISGTFAKELYFRQLMNHDATLVELPSPAPTGRSGSDSIIPIKSNVDSFNFQFVKWRVPKDVNKEKIDIKIFDPSENDLTVDNRTWDAVDGWRLSDMIASNTNSFFAADSRGFLLVDASSGKSEVIVFRSSILNDDGSDESWFQKFLIQNDLINNTFDASFNADRDLVGHMFDINPVTNSILFDSEKTAYWRPLALALNSAPPGVGVFMLDLVNNRINAPNQDIAVVVDLSNVKFIESGNTSSFPSSYNALPCAGLTGFDSVGIDGDTGSFYDPIDPNNDWNLFVPIPPGNLYTDWLLSTPFFLGKFDRNARVFVEAFLPDGALAREFSAIYVRTVPKVESSLSIDYTDNRDEAFSFFENGDLEILASYRLRDGYLQTQMNQLQYYADGNHKKPAFVHDDFKVVGYNLVLGDFPSYSVGEIISKEKIEICNVDDVDFEDIYSRKTITVPTGSDAVEINVDEPDLYRDLQFVYTIPNSATDIDPYLSLEFVSSGQVINNILLPTSPGSHKVLVDGRFYGGTPLKVYGDIVDVSTSFQINAITTTSDLISIYWINGRQTATAIDGRNRIFVFYTDEVSSNISVAMSGDLGSSWWVFRDIIRLKQGESAESPYVVVDKLNDTIYLFYKLDGRFLVVKRIWTGWFVCDDQFLSYEPPEEFDDKSDDLLSIDQYSEGGRALRQEPSYFVVGDGEELKFTEEIEQSRLRRENDLTTRFEFTGSTVDQMDQAFDSASYAIWYDDKAHFRVIFVSDEGRAFIKQSSDYQQWSYICKNVVLHKVLADDNPDEEDLGVENPQALYDDLNDSIYIFYFYDNAMFVRRFDNNLLYPQFGGLLPGEFVEDDEGGSYLSESILEHMKITDSSTSKPTFVVGEITGRLLEAIDSSDPTLIVDIFYPQEQIERFTDNFAIDSSAKPVGYSTKTGILRGLYKSDEGFIYGFTLNGMRPSLDVQLRLNPDEVTVNGN